MRFFLELSYDGTNYSGWQRQPAVPSIQGSIEDALKILYQKNIKVTGCGRTDAGVHARHYFAHVDLFLQDPNDTTQLLYKLNHLLSKDIACHNMYRTDDEKHARYDAISRKYEYHIHLSKNPFLDRFSTFLSYGKRIDVDVLKEVSELILETKEFDSFCKAHGGSTTTICKIYDNQWEVLDDGSRIVYHIKANRFLRGMVRLIVGTSLSVATGKLEMKELRKLVNKKERHPLMKSAPPQGLSLTEILYD